MPFRKIPLLLALTLLAYGSAHAASPKALLETLRKTYEGSRDLSARFVQTSHLAAAAMDRTVEGKVVFKKGGRMRWTYEGDDPQEIVSDGKTLWIHQIRDRNVVKKDLAQLPPSSRLALDLLSGFDGIAEAFDVKTCGETCLELRPREARAELTRVILQMDAKALDVRSVTTEDSLGNRTRVDLKSLKWNTGVKDDLFAFKVPRGVEVLESGEDGR